MLRTIENKQQCYALLNAGRLGNYLQTWTNLRNLNPVLRSSAKRVSIRYLDASNQAFQGHNVPISSLESAVHKLLDQGADFQKLVFNETPPDDRLTLQAEIRFQDTLSRLGLGVFYSCQRNMRQREALALDGQQVSGVNAWQLLQRHLWPADYADLLLLMEQFPEHVIELTSFEIAIGSLPRHNTVVWECRYY